ncbi:unnamed protein product [Spirodela intermedia]|uniref:Major facilitator superfamily (MFS) profile domain-containing protein n=1 Tax=Spirodela intermedia TaxID=51605 RepID=A0A7I8JJV9_SPIIN|nr:unnamed protein product [Spirodela intermedia]CAA6670428.1 unnamed protein product [Spirodela intermedia]
MGSAAALTTVIAVGPGRGRRQLPPTRHGATAGYYQRAGSLGRRGKQPYLSAPCFRKGRGENEVIDELLREGGDGGGGEEDELLLVEEKGTLDGKWRFPWEGLPQRYKLIGTTSLAFVICNMDKVNLSVAIIPMSHQFGWNSSTAGLIQSSFFWGYAISQLPGGWLAKFFGGRKVLEVGVLCWSLATMLVPLVAGFMPGLLLSRVLVGIGEGVSPSSATDLIARTIPLQERSRAVGIVFGGLSIGSVLGLLFAPPIIQNLGWESVFYIFGLVGLLCEELNLNLTEAAWVTILPSLGSILITSIAATFADNLISRGVETTTVRKICQSIAFISPAVCMTLSSLDLGLPHWEVVAFLTGGLALSSFALSGLYCTHQDISPEYASVLLGITNTVGAVPGIVGVSLTGILLDSTHSWSVNMRGRKCRWWCIDVVRDNSMYFSIFPC